MFQRFRLQRSLRNMPHYEVLVVHEVPASQVSAVIGQVHAQGWTFIRAEPVGERRGEVLYDLYFAREANKAARQRNGLGRVFPHEPPPPTPGE